MLLNAKSCYNELLRRATILTEITTHCNELRSWLNWWHCSRRILRLPTCPEFRISVLSIYLLSLKNTHVCKRTHTHAHAWFLPPRKTGQNKTTANTFLLSLCLMSLISSWCPWSLVAVLAQIFWDSLWRPHHVIISFALHTICLQTQLWPLQIPTSSWTHALNSVTRTDRNMLARNIWLVAQKQISISSWSRIICGVQEWGHCYSICLSAWLGVLERKLGALTLNSRMTDAITPFLGSNSLKLMDGLLDPLPPLREWGSVCRLAGPSLRGPQVSFQGA